MNYTINDVLGRNNDFLLNSTVEEPVEFTGSEAKGNVIYEPADMLKEAMRKIQEKSMRTLFQNNRNPLSL
jgi:hypothetical protein